MKHVEETGELRGARVWIGALVLVAFVTGVMRSLSDPDLPMHLATGEWIVRNGTFPTVEPFAWTRAGEPYFAYSWLPEIIYWQTLAAIGPIGLRLLQGLTIGGSVAAALVMGRVLKWRLSAVLVLAILHGLLTADLVATLRPQGILFVALPLSYALVHHMARDGVRWSSAVLLALLTSVVANSHLLFPLIALPLAHVLGQAPLHWRRLAAIATCFAFGAVLSPYAFDWPDIYRLIFGANVMLSAPSPIREFQPGFSPPSLVSVVGMIALFLAALPWLLDSRAFSVRQRIVLGCLWFGGLLAYALAVRSILIWWFALLPVVGWFLHHVQERDSGRIRPHAAAGAGVLLFACLALISLKPSNQPWPGDQGLAWRAVPTRHAREIEPLARWLAENTAPPERTRVLTSFNYGSFLTFRLPNYSMSVDARTIFPDSAALPDAYVIPSRRVILGPIASSEVAILPVRHPAGAVLDTASDWRRIGRTYGRGKDDLSRQNGGAILWVRRSWLERARLEE